MRVLWEQGRASVSEVAQALPGDPPPAYNSVLTRLRILEKKGYAGHAKTGRAFIYHPLVDQRQAREHAVTRLVSQLFDGSSSQLVLNLLEQSQVDPAEIRRLKAMLGD